MNKIPSQNPSLWERLSGLFSGMPDSKSGMPDNSVESEVTMKTKREFHKAYFEHLAQGGFMVKQSSSADYLADIYHNGQIMAFYTKQDTIIKNPFLEVPDRLWDTINDRARAIALRCGICTEKPYDESKDEKMKNGAFKLNELNGVVLSCKKHPLFDYVFSTYRADPDNKNQAIQRLYYYNKDAAFQDFAIRAGLVDEKKLFNETELKVIHAGLVKMMVVDNDLNQEDFNSVAQLINRIEDVLPELKKQEQEFDYSREFADRPDENEWEVGG